MRDHSHTLRIGSLALLGLVGGCGPGEWGSEVGVRLLAVDPAGAPLTAASSLSLAEGAYTLTVDQACVVVDTVVVQPLAEAASGETGESGGEACFCHGDPPHCHGDCGDTGSTGTTAVPVVGSISRVVDLLAGPVEIFRHGAFPAAYDGVTLALSRAKPTSVPAAGCPDLTGRTFHLAGTLTEVAGGQQWTLVIDLAADDRVSEALYAAEPAVGDDEQAAILDARLRLDRALSTVDWAGVADPAETTVTIGGPLTENVIAVGEVLAGLTASASYTMTPCTE
jgi:hypothetical protein